MADLRFPIGKFMAPAEIGPAQVSAWIDDIEALPARLRGQVRGYTADQLGTTYRPEGWTVAQVIHHLADSHINSYTRFRLALTEDHPTIRPYDEAAWARLPDAAGAPVEASLDLLQALHARWTRLLRSLDGAALDRGFVHPESGEIGLRHNIGLYAWHGRHHLAHISTLAELEGW